MHDADTIHISLMGVGDALGDGRYRAGARLDVPLDKTALPLTHDAGLAVIMPRGLA